MLAERMRWTALLMLLFFLWPDGPEMGSLGAHFTLLSLRACQRPAGLASPLPDVKPFGCHRWPEGCALRKVCPASKSGNFSVSPCLGAPFVSAKDLLVDARDWDAARMWEPVECDVECGIAPARCQCGALRWSRTRAGFEQMRASGGEKMKRMQVLARRLWTM
jgi:hypothetical protein